VKDLLKRIKHHEGFRKSVYQCTEGYDTIGYGFAIKDLELDEDLAEEILLRKVEKLIKRVRSKFDWLDSVPHEVQGVLVEMAYQMGLSSVCRFRLRICISDKWCIVLSFLNGTSTILYSINLYLTTLNPFPYIRAIYFIKYNFPMSSLISLTIPICYNIIRIC